MEGIQKAGVLVGARKILNLIEGSNVTLTIEDATDNRINITIASSGGGGGGTPSGTVVAETAYGTASSAGVSTDYSRGDHTHGSVGHDDHSLLTNVTANQHHNQSHSSTDHTDAYGPASADYLVGTANGTLTGGIVVGTSPGGELGGTWASPTVDATHSGSAHHTQSHNHSAAGDNSDLLPESLEITGGPFSLRGDITVNITADQNDWNPTGLADATVIRLTSDAARTITGMAGGADGRKICLMNCNTVSRVITFTNESASSTTAANRFTLPGNNSMEIDRGMAVEFVYDATDSRWRMSTPLGYSTTTPANIGTAATGTASFISRRDHVHATGAGTPSTQAFADAAATGAGPAASMTDHKHAMPTLGFGLTGNSAPAVSLTNVQTFVTATTSVSAATYADITGASTGALAAGTWLILAQCTGSSVNAQAIMHVAITNAANTVMAEGSKGIGASGTASVAQLGSVSLAAIVTGGDTYKLRGARGLTTITGTWTAMDGAGTNTTNNLTDNSDKGTVIQAIRIA